MLVLRDCFYGVRQLQLPPPRAPRRLARRAHSIGCRGWSRPGCWSGGWRAHTPPTRPRPTWRPRARRGLDPGVRSARRDDDEGDADGRADVAAGVGAAAHRRLGGGHGRDRLAERGVEDARTPLPRRRAPAGGRPSASTCPSMATSPTAVTARTGGADPTIPSGQAYLNGRLPGHRAQRPAERSHRGRRPGHLTP